jgi:hypothetical protein
MISWFLDTSIGRTVASVLALLVAGSIAYQRIRRGGVLSERERQNEATRTAREKGLRVNMEVSDEVRSIDDSAARERLGRWVR